MTQYKGGGDECKPEDMRRILRLNSHERKVKSRYLGALSSEVFKVGSAFIRKEEEEGRRRDIYTLLAHCFLGLLSLPPPIYN